MILAIVISAILLLVFGFVSLKKVKSDLGRDKNHIVNYRSRFINCADGAMNNSFDESEYNWLMTNSSKTQNLVNSIGLSQRFRPPFSNVEIERYQIVLNTVPIFFSYRNVCNVRFCLLLF